MLKVDYGFTFDFVATLKQQKMFQDKKVSKEENIYPSELSI